jgi:hypothetical protein
VELPSAIELIVAVTAVAVVAVTERFVALLVEPL